MIDRIDHLVLTVADIDATIDWYQRVLGMEPISFGDGRRALRFGAHKLNLHAAGHELEPKAGRPTPGSADICLIASVDLDAVSERVQREGAAIAVGPVRRSGALGAITSIYLRDPDGNLIEISTYGS